jgi:hypothetical protein
MQQFWRLLLFALQPVRASNDVANFAESAGIPLGLVATTKWIADNLDAYWAAGWAIFVVIVLLVVAGLRLQGRIEAINTPQAEILFDPEQRPDHRFIVGADGGLNPSFMGFRLGVRNTSGVTLRSVQVVIAELSPMGNMFLLTAYKGAHLKERDSGSGQPVAIPPSPTPTFFDVATREWRHNGINVVCDPTPGDPLPDRGYDNRYRLRITVTGDFPHTLRHDATFDLFVAENVRGELDEFRCERVRSAPQ